MIELKSIEKNDLGVIYRMKYSCEKPKWKEFDAPYFNDFKFINYDEFLKNESEFYFRDNCKGIYLDGEIIGCVTRYWEDESTRWIKIGIVIYDEYFWHKGYGKEALQMWITEIFRSINDIESIGLTTWSGNIGMIKVAEKLGMSLEARFRKVRYYKGVYYDSVSYGVLRSEWKF